MERPILFNTEMVMAILEGKKTQTRRIIKPQPKQPIPLGVVVSSTESKNEGCFGWGQDKCGGIIDYAKPPYKVGDILYVRETWANTWTPDGDEGFVYRADGKPSTFLIGEMQDNVSMKFGYLAFICPKKQQGYS